MLDGEVAVPCNLQSAKAGSIAIVRLMLCHRKGVSDVDISTLRNDCPLNPVRPGREQR
uniref:Uncharacterized protein n=1 Tax=uncultured marine microorganism HF4000_ANIW141I9 TaxID=455537 RepID=B3T5H1_9ZZZZ|nr:hypothetical protein ALOHA_HF4000ANIW141I9ctg2g18 [uncultured marine microorganism HF4000_ANIW141I9]